MVELYQKIQNKKLLISCISISNLIFINSWLRINAFNIYNYYPLNGYDLSIILATFFSFIIFFLINYIFILYLKKNHDVFFSIFLSLLLILAINSMRSSFNLEFLSLKNISTIIIFFLIIITFIFLLIFKKSIINNFFEKFGLITLPFFLIILFKIIFNMIILDPINTEQINKSVYIQKNFNKSNIKNKIVWIVFDQLDSKFFSNETLEENNLDNFLKIISTSDYYNKYTPITEETTKEIPSILSGKNYSKYKYTIEDNKIRLKLSESNFYKTWDINNTIFKKIRDKSLNLYLNGWYHPYCSLFQDYYAKCFHSLYGYFTTLKFRGLINTVIFQFVSIIPGYEFIIEKLKIDSLKIFTQKGSEFLEAKINFSNSSKDFLNTLKNNKMDFYFFHSSIPHEPFIYNSSEKRLISNYYTEKSKYIDNLKLVDIFVGKVIKILNENNNYESSIIIIQGDTGIGKNYINSNIEDRIGSTPLIIKKSYQLDGNVIEDKLLSNNLSKKINKILFE